MKFKPLFDDSESLGELTPEGVKVSKKVYKTIKKLVKTSSKGVSLKHLELMLMRASTSECSWESLNRFLTQSKTKKRGKK
jgi:hypothetical protein